MTGRKRKQKLLSETARDGKKSPRDTKNEKFELITWAGLPIEILEFIVSRFTLQENIQASAVCKRWQSAALAVRVVNRAPLLMYFPKYGNLFEFYDPSARKFHSVEFPQLTESRVCYTKDGWLLLYRSITHCMFFFNPFTLEVINLPRFELGYQIVAFSCPPSSESCIVVTIKHVSPTLVAISTCHPGAEEWTTVHHQNRLPFVSSVFNKLVFCNGLFYCQSLTGWLGVFNPLQRTWSVLSVPPPKCPENFFAKNWWKGKFMTQNNGDVLVIYTCSSENPIIFKLDQMNMAWEEMKTLDGATLFASFLTTHSNTSLPGIRRNNVYFSKIRFYGRQCISYSLEDDRYHPRNECHDWGELDPFKSIWIEPPEDFSNFNE